MNTTILEGTKAIRNGNERVDDHMHQHPELALQETETAKFIAEKVTSFAFDVVEGIGKTSVVASMTLGDSKKSPGKYLGFQVKYSLSLHRSLRPRSHHRVLYLVGPAK